MDIKEVQLKGKADEMSIYLQSCKKIFGKTGKYRSIPYFYTNSYVDFQHFEQEQPTILHFSHKREWPATQIYPKGRITTPDQRSTVQI